MGNNNFVYKIIALLDSNVEPIAIILTALQFLSGILVCEEFIKNGTTADASCLPFLCGVLSCYLWISYGYFVRDFGILSVNTLGLFLMMVYTLAFYKYTSKKITTVTNMIVTMIMIFIVQSIVFHEQDEFVIVNSLGVLAGCSTVVTAAAPLSKIVYVTRTKSTKCLPFPMILMSFIVSLPWVRYGAHVEDIFLIIPNVIGSGLAFFQLLLFYMYRRIPNSHNKYKDLF